MTIWAISMVKDEMDVFPFTLAHLITQGVDGFVIADNMSTDGTWEFLNDFVDYSCVPVHLLRDEEVAYYQSTKMTEYYNLASKEGADWVIPFDADEVWYAESGVWLADLFGHEWQADYLEASLYNYFPTSQDDPKQVNPFLRIIHRDCAPAPLVKVAVRGGIDGLVIEQGNHGARAPQELRALRPGLAVGHFPWRSPKQFELKVRNGGQAYEAATDTTRVPASQGQHWRQYWQVLQESGPAAVRQIYDEWFLDPPVEITEMRVPWTG